MYGISKPFVRTRHVFDVPEGGRSADSLCGADPHDEVYPMAEDFDSLEDFVKNDGDGAAGCEGICPHCLTHLDWRHNLPTEWLEQATEFPEPSWAEGSPP